MVLKETKLEGKFVRTEFGHTSIIFPQDGDPVVQGLPA